MDARLQLAERLAAELRRRGLERHLAQLRGYYAGVRAGRAAAWSDAHVALLGKVFQVEPWTEALERRPAGGTCCPGFLARTVLIIAERHLVSCSGCERRWLVVEEALAA